MKLDDDQLKQKMRTIPDAGPIDLDARLAGVRGAGQRHIRRRRNLVVAAAIILVMASIAGVASISNAGGDQARRAAGQRSSSGNPAIPAATRLVRASASRVQPGVSAALDRRLVADNTDFAFDLYHHLRDGDANLFFSPYSISAALAMVYAGAGGATATQIAGALHFTLPPDQLQAAFNDLDQRLSKPAPLAGMTGDPLTLEPTNALWSQDGYALKEHFLEVLASYYGAGMNLVDFIRDPEGARRAINAWVAAKTHGRITDLLAKGDIDVATRLVLVNTIYFHAGWLTKLMPQGAGTFTTLAGPRVSAPMMGGTLKLDYTSALDYEAVRLPYVGEASMTIIVPRAGRFTHVESGLNAGLVATMNAGLKEHMMTLSLPRFKFSSALDLVPPLRRMGVVDAFSLSGADFTGMTGGKDLYIGALKHQAVVSVDENGTEAAAATAVVFDPVSLPRAATLTVDRPFIFLIQDQRTGTVLFAGRVTNPAA